MEIARAFDMNLKFFNCGFKFEVQVLERYVG